jgi:hypothetical protein
MPEWQLRGLLTFLLKWEGGIEDQFRLARSRLTDHEKQLGGFETYGAGGKHWRFKGLLNDFGITLGRDVPTPIG